VGHLIYLQVVGGPINLWLMHARVGEVKTATSDGTIKLNFLRQVYLFAARDIQQSSTARLGQGETA